MLVRFIWPRKTKTYIRLRVVSSIAGYTYEELQKALSEYETDDDSVDDFETVANRDK